MWACQKVTSSSPSASKVLLTRSLLHLLSQDLRFNHKILYGVAGFKIVWYLCTSERWTSINKYKSPGPNLRSKCATKQYKTSFSWCVWGNNKKSEKASKCSIKSNEPSPIQRQNNELLSVQLVANFFSPDLLMTRFLLYFYFTTAACRDIIKKSFQVSVRHI